jgi:hypothetical protein
MDAMDFEFDEEDDLSSALGTESFAARDMVPKGFDNAPRAHGLPEQLIQGRRYLKVDQSANKRNGSKVSKIWQHGQWAFDTLSCPATSCECERVFSSTKKLITPERNKLQDDTIEALECLKAWFDKGLIEREDNVQ